MKNDSNLVSKKGEEKEALSQGSFPEKILLSFELLLSITTTDLPSIKLPKSISKFLHIHPKKVSACVSCFPEDCGTKAYKFAKNFTSTQDLHKCFVGTRNQHKQNVYLNLDFS